MDTIPLGLAGHRFELVNKPVESPAGTSVQHGRAMAADWLDRRTVFGFRTSYFFRPSAFGFRASACHKLTTRRIGRTQHKFRRKFRRCVGLPPTGKGLWSSENRRAVI